MSPARPRRPCANCPWRLDAPARLWHPEEFARIWATCQDDGTHIMLCHKSSKLDPPDRHLACQGWVRVMGFSAIGVRLAACLEWITLAEVEDRGGPELYGSFEEMMRAQGFDFPLPRNVRR